MFKLRFCKQCPGKPRDRIGQVSDMPGIIEFPTLVQQAVTEFGAVFANEPERVHFADATWRLTGLLVAERKTVNGISSEFAETRYARSGVIPIDNVLIAGQAPRLNIGTAGSIGGWARVNCANARARLGICTSCCCCTPCSWLNCGRAVRVLGLTPR
jgi:uncharacterized protein (DUF1330 family)